MVRLEKLNMCNAMKRSSSWKPENRELPFGARQSVADSELTLEQPAEGGRATVEKEFPVCCVGSDGIPPYKGEGMSVPVSAWFSMK